MSKEYRSLYAGLVDHPKFLPLSADAKLVFFMAKLQLGASGIGVLYAGTLAGQIGSSWDTARVDAALDELCAGGGRAWFDREQNVVWIRKGLENEPHIKLKRDTHRASICNHLDTLPKLAICNRFAAHYGLPLPHPDLRVPPTLEATLSPTLAATGIAEDRKITATETGAKAPEAPAPRVEQTDEELDREIRGVIPPLVREHLWLGKQPPQYRVGDRPVDMGREISAARHLVGKYGLDAVAGAIPHMRTALGVKDQRRLTLLYFVVGDKQDRFHLARAQWESDEQKKAAEDPRVSDLLARLPFGGADAAA